MAVPDPFPTRLALVPPDASPEAHQARMLALRDALASLLNEQRLVDGLEPLPLNHPWIDQFVKLSRVLVEDLPPIFEFGFGTARIYIEKENGMSKRDDRLIIRVAASKDRRI